jgi:hypothetical protein
MFNFKNYLEEENQGVLLAETKDGKNVHLE